MMKYEKPKAEVVNFDDAEMFMLWSNQSAIYGSGRLKYYCLAVSSYYGAGYLCTDVYGPQSSCNNKHYTYYIIQ